MTVYGNRVAKRILLLWCLVAVSAMTAIEPASAAPLYNIVPLGLDDLEHTRNDGYRSSDAHELNEAGQVSGFSVRYNGGSANLGNSAWLYDGGNTINIGLTGNEHTSSGGSKYSLATYLNEAGQVSGRSYRYNGGSTYLGLTAWLYDGVTTVDIGLTGTEHTKSDGSKYSYPAGLNEAGQVAGLCSRYNGGSADLGRSAWFYDGATTIDIGLADNEHTATNGARFSTPLGLNQAGYVNGDSFRWGAGAGGGKSAWIYDGVTTSVIGLTGPEHTSSSGYKHSLAGPLNDAGQVIGRSDRYNGGSTQLGQSVWLYDGATTIDIGLTGPEHTRNDGYKYSFVRWWNDAGQVIGWSDRYNGVSTKSGQSAWLYEGATTIEIGLTDSEHTHSGGYTYSDAFRLNEAGQVSGFSVRYNGGSTNLGSSAWLYDGKTSVHIGLTGSEHTRSDGYKYAESRGLNEAGQVIGISHRYNGGSTELNQSVWLYDGATTIDVGLIGPEHTRNDGLKYSNTGGLNEAGQVTGYSLRYNGGSTQLGFDSWFYDPVLNQTIPLQLSMRSDGYASSYVSYLGDDGLVLGTYTLFDALDNNLGDRAFYFTIADGLHDLGSLVDGGLTANGWDYLASALRANGLGQILGHGKLTSQSTGQMPYLLTPVVVPEPSTFALATLALFAVFLNGRSPRPGDGNYSASNVRSF
jgi:hypothetical protein